MLVIAAASIKWPEILIASAICMFGMESWFQAKSVYFVNHSSYFNLAILGVMCARVGLAVVRREAVTPFRNRVWLCGVLLILYAIYTGVWTPADKPFVSNWRKGGPYIVMYVMLMPFLFTSVAVIRRSLLHSMLLGAATVAMLYLTCNWDVRGVIVAGQAAWAQEHQTSAVLSIAQLSGSIAVIAGLWKAERGKLLAAAKWSIVILGLLVAIRTGSRGQTIAAAVCIFMFLPITNGMLSARGLFITLGGVAFFGISLFFLAENFATHERWNRMGSSLEGRSEMWEVIMREWLAAGPFAWLFGLGNAASYEYVGIYVHNLPIEILTEEGLVGAGLYLLLVYYVVRGFLQGVRTVADGRGETLRNSLIICMALFCFELLGTFKSGSLYGNQLFITYGVLVSVLGRNLVHLSRAMIKSPAITHPRAKSSVPSNSIVGI